METVNFAKITVLSGLITCFRLVCGLLISKVVAVYTGPAGISNLGQLQNFVTFINGFISSQVSQGVNRFSAENKHDFNQAKSYWKASIQLSGIACCLIISLGFIFSKVLSEYLFYAEGYSWLIILALLVLPLNIANNIFLGVLNGLGEHNRFFLANFFAIGSSVLSMSILVYFWGMKGAFISAALNNAVAGAWLLVIIYQRPWFRKEYWIGHVPRQHLNEMMKYFIMGVVGALTGPISLIAVRTILMNNLSVDDSGYWQAVTKVSEAYLAILMTAMTVYYFPKTAAARTLQQHMDILKQGAIIVVPLAFFMAFMVFVLKDFIISLLFTSAFNKTRELFLFQNIGDFVRICSWLFATILLAKGYFKLNAILEITFSVSYPLLVKFLIIKFGLEGATIAYLINYSIYFLFAAMIYVWHVKFRIANATSE